MSLTHSNLTVDYKFNKSLRVFLLKMFLNQRGCYLNEVTQKIKNLPASQVCTIAYCMNSSAAYENVILT